MKTLIHYTRTTLFFKEMDKNVLHKFKVVKGNFND